ncbi:MAG: DUF2490 domain-containing protein [Candidatus Omnitrophica bacterium]|nr:DUF2490 domain-containing protein [Candidatus Omnitrophota bacterium]
MKRFYGIGVLLFFSVFFLSDCAAFDDGDFQYWNNESISWKVNENWKVTLEEELRFGDDGGNIYYQHSDLGVVYSGIASWLDVGVNYRYVREERNSRWKDDSQPHLNATVKWSRFGFSLSDRSRFEYREREDAEDYWRYRNNFTVKLPWKFTRFEIRPFVADEIFYDFDAETLNKNRFFSGISFKITKQVSGDIFYLWETSEKNEKWNDLHVLGTKIKLNF